MPHKAEDNQIFTPKDPQDIVSVTQLGQSLMDQTFTMGIKNVVTGPNGYVQFYLVTNDRFALVDGHGDPMVFTSYGNVDVYLRDPEAQSSPAPAGDVVDGL